MQCTSGSIAGFWAAWVAVARCRTPAIGRHLRRTALAAATLTVLCLATLQPAQALTPHAPSPPSQPSQQAMMEALARANASVVGVRVSTVEDAASAETLGDLRHGTGVVISPDGLVLTIGYLLLEAEQIEIITQDNKTVPARAVAYDLATGFGLLRPLLPLTGVSVAPLGQSMSLNTGEALMAVTGPHARGDNDADAEISMTRLVSKRAFSGTWEYHIDTALFTSPPLQSGGGNHSGAPLFNQRGELIGVGSLLVPDASGERRRMPGNMFVPVDLLKPILAELQTSGSTGQSHRPWLGVTSNDQEGKVQILRVSRDSPAENAGLSAGDVVLAVDGARVSTLEEFYKKVWARGTPDADISLTVQQGSDTRTVQLKGADRLLTFKKPSSI